MRSTSKPLTGDALFAAFKQLPDAEVARFWQFLNEDEGDTSDQNSSSSDETAYLLASPAMRERLLRALERSHARSRFC